MMTAETTIKSDNEVKADPTALTTQMVFREVQILDDKIEANAKNRHAETNSLKELLESKQAQSDINNAERFGSFRTQFELIERQRVEQKKDTKDAVDAALIAQKEAVQEQTIASGLSIAKSETATAKQLDQLGSTVTVAIGGVTQQLNEMKDNFNLSIGDLKDRMSRYEAIKAGATEERHNNKENISTAQSIIYMVVAGVSLISMLAAFGVLHK